MRPPLPYFCLQAAACLLVPACSSGKGGTTPATQVEKYYFPAIPEPPEINEENLDEALRRFRDLKPNSSFYEDMRTRLTQVLYRKHQEAAEKGKNDEAYEAFSTSVKFFGPEEILAGDIHEEVEKMADWVVEVYSPLGDEAKVLGALIILMNRRPDDEAIAGKYETLSRWIEEARKSFDDRVQSLSEIIGIYEAIAEHAPVPVVTTKLFGLYRKRHSEFSELLETYEFKGMSFGSVYLQYYFMNSMLERTSYDILRLYTIMGRPVDALSSIESYRGMRGYDPRIVRVLEEMTSEPKEATYYLVLSEIFLETDYEQAMWSCYRGWKQDSTDYRFPMCIAKLYREQGDRRGAEEYLNVARSLKADNPEILTRLITLYSEWLDDAMTQEEKNEDALEILGKLEKSFESFESRWPDREAPLEWGQIVKSRGIIEFRAGDIDDSVEHLKQAGYQSGDTESLMTLGTIYTFEGKTGKAMAALSDALDVHHPSQMTAKFFKLRIYQKMADAERLGGKAKKAEKHYKEALDIAAALIPYISLDFVGRVRVIEGQLKHRLGNREEALESFKTAVTLSGDEGTYAQVLSYLVGARDIGSMRELYHLAYTDSSLPRKWKVYFSLWYVALQKLMGKADDSTPRQVLSMTGEKDEWIEKLAAYYSGRMPYEEIVGLADTGGRNVELDFFRAFELFEQGKKKEFIGFLEKALDSGYYGYYEAAMALEILHGMGVLK